MPTRTGRGQVSPLRWASFERRRSIGALLLTVLTVGALVSIPLFRGLDGGSPSPHPVASVPLAGGCSGGALASVTITPGNVSLQGGASQVFTAVARNSCGGSLANLTNISWSLSRNDLGALSSSWGPSIIYRSCIAPMGGFLTAVANYGGTRVNSKAGISIWFDLGTANGTTPSSSGRSVEGCFAAGALVLSGIALAIWRYRQGARSPASDSVPGRGSAPTAVPTSPPAEGTSGPQANPSGSDRPDPRR